MKMKNRLKIFLCTTAAVLLMPACTKSQYILYENDIQSKVYFTAAATNPLVEVSAADLDENGEYGLCIYNVGNNDGKITVEVYVDDEALTIYNIEQGRSYQILPQECYSLSRTSFTLF